MAGTPSLAADWIAFYQFPADPVREDRRQHILDLQFGSIRALDFVQPFLNLHGLHAAGKMTVLESARDDRLELANLLTEPTDSLLKIRGKAEAKLPLSLAEWTL